MSEHTPGPWRHGPYMHDKKYRVVYFSTRRGEPYSTSALEPEDARLIAAAPDLLEACKAMMRAEPLWLPGGDPEYSEEDATMYRLCQTIEAAIAKATGASQ